MHTCTFFGHRDCPDSLEPLIFQCIEDLVLHYDVTMFYVGNQGRFDRLVRAALRRISRIYPFVKYAVVLAYMPNEATLSEDSLDTMLPEGIETIHPHYAISWRNNWMLTRADFVIAYVVHSWGGTAKYVSLARKKNKQIFFLNSEIF